MIRVLLADDQSLIRAGFRILLESADDIEVVGEAVDGAQATEMVREHRADVVLMNAIGGSCCRKGHNHWFQQSSPLTVSRLSRVARGPARRR